MTPLRPQRAPLAGDAAAVGRHYNRHTAAEALRLEKYFPVEYAITARYLERYIPENCAVAEIGVGGAGSRVGVGYGGRRWQGFWVWGEGGGWGGFFLVLLELAARGIYLLDI